MLSFILRNDNENTNKLAGFTAKFWQSFAKDITTKSSEAEQVGYSFGYLMGKSNADSLQGIDLDAFSAGLKAAAAGKQATLSEEEMARVLTQFKRQAEAKELITLKNRLMKMPELVRRFWQRMPKTWD